MRTARTILATLIAVVLAGCASRPINESIAQVDPKAGYRPFLLIPKRQNPLRAAFALALLAWLPPALLAVAQSAIDSSYSGWGFFTDSTVYTRYLIAIWAMIATSTLRATLG